MPKNITGNITRMILDFVLFACILFLPWWLSLVLVLGSIIYFPFYLEALPFAYFFDTLYAKQLNFPCTALTLVTVFLLVSMFVKTKIRR